MVRSQQASTERKSSFSVAMSLNTLLIVSMLYSSLSYLDRGREANGQGISAAHAKEASFWTVAWTDRTFLFSLRTKRLRSCWKIPITALGTLHSLFASVLGALVGVAGLSYGGEQAFKCGVLGLYFLPTWYACGRTVGRAGCGAPQQDLCVAAGVDAGIVRVLYNGSSANGQPEIRTHSRKKICRC